MFRRNTQKERVCPDCKHSRIKKSRQKPENENKPLRERKKKPKEKVDNSECKTCRWGFRWGEWGIGCGYMVKTGKPRPCEPPPGCRMYEKGRGVSVKMNIKNAICRIARKSKDEKEAYGRLKILVYEWQLAGMDNDEILEKLMEMEREI